MCIERIEREKVAEHRDKECGFTVVSCRYREIGCPVNLKRHDMIQHEEEDDKRHLHMALGVVTALKRTVTLLEEKSTTLKLGETILLKVDNFETRRQNGEIFTSPSFYTNPNGYHMTVRVYANGCGYGKGTHVSIYMQILEGKHDTRLTWPFAGSLNVKLLNQLEDANHHSKVIKQTIQSFDVDTGTIRGCAKFIPHSRLGPDADHCTQYLKDDVLYIRVSVDVVGRRQWLE